MDMRQAEWRYLLSMAGVTGSATFALLVLVWVNHNGKPPSSSFWPIPQAAAIVLAEVLGLSIVHARFRSELMRLRVTGAMFLLIFLEATVYMTVSSAISHEGMKRLWEQAEPVAESTVHGIGR